MYTTISTTTTPLTSKAGSAKLARVAQTLLYSTRPLSCASPTSYVLFKQQELPSRRHFSSTKRTQLKEFFPPPANAPNIKLTPPAWHHPVYTEQNMRDIKIAHREAVNWSDKWALTMARILRWGMDMATWYTHDEDVSTGKKDPKHAKVSGWGRMTERKWLIRSIFLESVAGVPGMVGGSLRHLQSLRKMKRDNGWIETLLEEAFNERMHLLTFLKMAEPGWFMKFMILGAQGVFYNGMFLSYLISPRTCHRFVGYLEEEAVITYTRIIADIDAGKLPKWQTMEAPEIAIRYWNMPEGHRTIRDLMLYIRADEAKHREVNHTLGNLDQTTDPNPFVSEYVDPDKPHPGKGIENIRPIGWERKEVV